MTHIEVVMLNKSLKVIELHNNCPLIYEFRNKLKADLPVIYLVRTWKSSFFFFLSN